MIRLGFILILLWVGFCNLPCQNLHAQDIVWEKQWGFAPGSEQINKVCPAQDGNFWAVGYSTKFRQDYLGNTYFFPLLIKLDENGDTLFMKRINVMRFYFCYIGNKFGSIYQLVFTTPQPGFGGICPVIVEFNEDGDILETKIFTQLNYHAIGDGIRTPDGGLLFSGVGIGPGTNQCAFKFNFLNELEWATAYFPPVTIAGFGERIEPMANGHYLLSGTLGKRIYGFEIDSAGNEVSQKEFYQTPTNIVLSWGNTSQTWRKGFLSMGNFSPSSSVYKMILASNDSLNNKIWGGEQTGILGSARFVNREFSFIFSSLEGDKIYLNRLDKDSSVIWKVLVGGPNDPKKAIEDMYFFHNDTGLVAGSVISTTGNQGQQFWIAKIAGVGTAYDPTNPGDTVTVSAQEKLFQPKDAPLLYPNPTTETIRFQKLTRETLVAIYSTKGEKLMEKWILPEHVLDVCSLPVGAYLYHLKMGERVFTGKFFKK